METNNITTLPQSITVIGRRWFQRGPGNTYHTAEIIVDGQTVHKTPRQYGYGEQYAYTAWEWLQAQGVIPKASDKNCHFRHIRDDLGIPYSYQAIDVPRKKDL